jgi:hypothetical protein
MTIPMPNKKLIVFESGVGLDEDEPTLFEL